MAFDDFLYRGTIDPLGARFTYTLTSTLVNEAVINHNCDPTTAHILGRALTAGILSSPLLDGNERLMIRWAYEGAIQSVVVDVGAESDIRGFINPTNLTKSVQSEADIFGATCQVYNVKSSNATILNSGVSKSIFQDPVEDLAHTYCISDQVESTMVVMIGFDPNPEKPVALCHGLMLQALPDCDLEHFDRIRSRMKDPEVRKLLQHQPESDNHFEHIIKSLTTGEQNINMSITECTPPVFRCTCSQQRMIEVLHTLPSSEREDVLAKEEEIRMTCHYCNKVHEIPFPSIKKAFGET